MVRVPPVAPPPSDPELPEPDYATWAHDVGFNDRDVVVDPDRLDAALAALVGA